MTRNVIEDSTEQTQTPENEEIADKTPGPGIPSRAAPEMKRLRLTGDSLLAQQVYQRFQETRDALPRLPGNIIIPEGNVNLPELILNIAILGLAIEQINPTTEPQAFAYLQDELDTRTNDVIASAMCCPDHTAHFIMEANELVARARRKSVKETQGRYEHMVKQNEYYNENNGGSGESGSEPGGSEPKGSRSGGVVIHAHEARTATGFTSATTPGDIVALSSIGKGLLA